MANPKLNAVFAAAVTFGLAACDRLPPRWSFQAQPSTVTVKLPPAKTAAPGFQFGSAPPAAAQDGASLNSA